MNTRTMLLNLIREAVKYDQISFMKMHKDVYAYLGRDKFAGEAWIQVSRLKNQDPHGYIQKIDCTEKDRFEEILNAIIDKFTAMGFSEIRAHDGAFQRNFDDVAKKVGFRMKKIPLSDNVSRNLWVFEI